MRTSPLSVMLVTAPSSRDHTMSGSCCTGTQLSASAAALSNPFWYSRLNLYDTSAPTHWCLVASRLGVVNMYVKEVVVCAYHKQGIGQIFFEVFSNAPLQHQEFQLRAMIFLL